MIPTKKLNTLLALTALSALSAGAAFAGDWGKVVIDDKMPIAEPWSICDIFDYSTLYEGDGFIREFKIKGRYHGQWEDNTFSYDDPATDAAFPQSGDRSWYQRRFRIGYGVEFANGWELSNTFNVRSFANPTRGSNDPGFWSSVEELVLEKDFGNFEIAIGKQKPDIMREYATSSKKIKTIERSNIVNQVNSDKIWGVAVGFEAAGLSHVVGAYSNVFSNNWEWPRANGGAMLRYSAEAEVSESTSVFFDYAYNNASAMYSVDQSNSNVSEDGQRYDHVIAIGTENDFGRLGLVTDLIFGIDFADNKFNGDDTYGFVFMPYYAITDNLEAVFRYAYMDKGDLQNPMDNQEDFQPGGYDPYVADLHTLYVGLNYYICGDKLKLMAGYEWGTGTDLERQVGEDFNTSSWTLGVRTYW